MSFWKRYKSSWEEMTWLDRIILPPLIGLAWLELQIRGLLHKGDKK